MTPGELANDEDTETGDTVVLRYVANGDAPFYSITSWRDEMRNKVIFLQPHTAEKFAAAIIEHMEGTK